MGNKDELAMFITKASLLSLYLANVVLMVFLTINTLAYKEDKK